LGPSIIKKLGSTYIGMEKASILSLHDLLSLPQTPFSRSLRSIPFVIRGIQWERYRLQMADLNERKNGVWGREKGNRANTEDVLQLLGALKIRFLKNAQKTQDLISHFGALDYAEISNFRCPTRDKNDEWIIPTKVAWIQNLFQKSNINS